nr:sulfotransferase family 2 domain-containing protein [uncultured Psychroserpens sp.]
MLSIFSKKKNSHIKESVFLHIPKSGGSTFVGLLQVSLKDGKTNSIDSPTHKTDRVGSTTIFHLDFLDSSRRFKGAHIFNESQKEMYSNSSLFLLLRNPIDRLVSEFNFQYHILDGKNGNSKAAILTRLKQKPKTLKEYIECKETQNYQLKFLLGRPINDQKKVADKEFKTVLEKIKTLPIHCGVTDEYSSFLNLFEEKTGNKLSKKVIVRKKTPFIYEEFLDEETKSRIIQLNEFDYKLYTYVKSKVIVNNKKFKFVQSDKFIV